MKNKSDWNFKNLTEVPFGNSNFLLEFQRSIVCFLFYSLSEQ